MRRPFFLPSLVLAFAAVATACVGAEEPGAPAAGTSDEFVVTDPMDTLRVDLDASRQRPPLPDQLTVDPPEEWIEEDIPPEVFLAIIDHIVEEHPEGIEPFRIQVVDTAPHVDGRAELPGVHSWDDYQAAVPVALPARVRQALEESERIELTRWRSSENPFCAGDVRVSFGWLKQMINSRYAAVVSHIDLRRGIPEWQPNIYVTYIAACRSVRGELNCRVEGGAPGGAEMRGGERVTDSCPHPEGRSPW